MYTHIMKLFAIIDKNEVDLNLLMWKNVHDPLNHGVIYIVWPPLCKNNPHDMCIGLDGHGEIWKQIYPGC